MIIDSFIVAGESKWGQTTRLTLLLPHGYEGAGPEHSSARIERFIQLGSEGNIRLANPTTAAQYFHLLRRQARIAKPRPLVVFTPKGLLRLRGRRLVARGADRAAASSSSSTTRARPSAARRSTASCSAAARSSTTSTSTSAASARARSRSPGSSCSTRSPATSSQTLIASYPNLKKVVWAQEEPKNMGAWSVMARRLPELLPDGVELQYVGRPQRSSPSEGYPAAHRLEQERIVLTALEGCTTAARRPRRRAASKPHRFETVAGSGRLRGISRRSQRTDGVRSAGERWPGASYGRTDATSSMSSSPTQPIRSRSRHGPWPTGRRRCADCHPPDGDPRGSRDRPFQVETRRVGGVRGRALTDRSQAVPRPRRQRLGVAASGRLRLLLETPRRPARTRSGHERRLLTNDPGRRTPGARDQRPSIGRWEVDLLWQVPRRRDRGGRLRDTFLTPGLRARSSKERRARGPGSPFAASRPATRQPRAHRRANSPHAPYALAE